MLFIHLKTTLEIAPMHACATATDAKVQCWACTSPASVHVAAIRATATKVNDALATLMKSEAVAPELEYSAIKALQEMLVRSEVCFARSDAYYNNTFLLQFQIKKIKKIF